MTFVDHMWERVSPEPNTGCWLWMNCVDKDDYGIMYWKGKNRRAHRVFYEECTGREIPVGLVPDHLCRVRGCCNPEHVEPVTNKVNLNRGRHAKREQTACIRGHLAFTRARNGHRYCAECNRERMRAHYRAGR